MLCSLLVLLVLDVLVRSGLPVLPVLVTVLAVLVLFVLFVLAIVVLAVLVLVDWILLSGAFCAAHGSVPTRASSSSVANIETRGAPCWRRWEKR